MIREQIKDIELSIRKISDRASKKEDCIRFDIGQPSFDTPQHVKEAAKKGLSERQGYTPTYGLEELREKIAEEESDKKGIETSPEKVLVTVGGMEALYTVFTSVLSEEDTAVFNDPCWGPYKLISSVNGNDFVQVKYFRNGELTDEAKEEIRDSKLVVVNTPSNPLGRVLDENQAREMAEFADENDTLLVSDEVYHRLTYGREHVSPAQFSEDSLIIGSVSKNHAMTGWRIGWITAPEEYLKEFAKSSRALTASPPKISQQAAIEALENDSHVKEMKETYRERRDLLVERMKDLGWDFVAPEGAIYAFPEVNEDSWEFCINMIEKGVAMVPGEPMSPESSHNVRICFGSTTKDEIRKAFDKLEEEIS